MSRQVDYNFNSLKKELLRRKILFTDPEFSPQEKSLFSGGSVQPEKMYLKRPKEITPDAQFVIDSVYRHDIHQGDIGNCWFIAGVAILANTRKDLFERVVPLDQGFEPGRYTGMFKFNFWCFGKWVEVIIDDFLPTDGKNLIYASNRKCPHEFWPCLLEKAYAKLYGSYRALIGGELEGTLVDMTGGISEVIDIRDKSKISPRLYSLLVTSCKMDSLIGASINERNNLSTVVSKLPNGLYTLHSYSITGFYKVDTERVAADLLRLRNPWGNNEWTGAWADNSNEMLELPKQKKDELKFQRKDDGEFWMSFDDFIKNFDAIQLCHIQIDSLVSELEDNDNKQLWYINQLEGAWIKGENAGGCGNSPNEALYRKNPQMTITLMSPDETLGHGDKCAMIVSLMNKDHRAKPNIAIGFSIHTSHGQIGDSNLIPGGRSDYINHREVTKRFELNPGRYVIVASTFHPHEEAQFLLRVFTEHPTAESRKAVFEETVELPPRVSSENDLVSRTFERHAGSDQRLDALELCAFLEDIATMELGGSLKLSVESCRSLVIVCSKDKSGFLSLNEAQQAWKEIRGCTVVFQQLDVNRSHFVDVHELETMFVKLGLQVSQNVLTSIVRRYGGRANQISLPDFILAICKLTSLFSTFQEQQRARSGSGDTAEFTRNEFLESTLLT